MVDCDDDIPRCRDEAACGQLRQIPPTNHAARWHVYSAPKPRMHAVTRFCGSAQAITVRSTRPVDSQTTIEAGIAAVAVRALTDDDLLATSPVLTGPESLVPSQQVAVLSEALGLPARFEEISTAEARANAVAAGWPDGIADALFDGGEIASQETTPGVETIAGRPPRSLRQWALDHASEFR